MSRAYFLVLFCTSVVAMLAKAFVAPRRHHHRVFPSMRPSSRRLSSSNNNNNNNNNNDYSEDTPYRSIGEVVGGLHGGKYQFQAGVSASDYSLDGPASSAWQDEPSVQVIQELPRWALRMKPSENVPILQVPSNANRQNGMIHSSQVTITNDERTWEPFHARVVTVRSNGNQEDVTDNGLFMIRPASGDLAPRGGASNACDASQPYSDSATLQVIHNENADVQAEDGVQYYLLVGTEEEQWSYRLVLSE